MSFCSVSQKQSLSFLFNMASLGWVFRVPQQHPWIVISDPAKHPDLQCLCINITDETNYHGGGLILDPGTHPWIVKPSVLYFAEAIETRATLIDLRIRQNHILRGDDAETKLLLKIIDACRKSKYLPRNLRHYLHL